MVRDGDGLLYDASNINYECFGTKIHIWNVCDSSRLRATNILINGGDPETACVNSNWHGPTGRWWNGATCDYYGKYGLYAINQYTTNNFYNYGIYRLMVGGRGILKSLFEHEYREDGATRAIAQQETGGGAGIDQLNAQGYQTVFDITDSLAGTDITSSVVVKENSCIGNRGLEFVFGGGHAGTFQMPGKINPLWTHAAMVEGAGMLWDQGQLHPQMPTPPLHMAWNGYHNNYLDESAASLFANAKHGANKKVGLCSIYKSLTPPTSGGEGRDGLYNLGAVPAYTFGLGVRSLNIFELTHLV